MAEDVNIMVKHLTRVEGHGNIHFNTKNGEITKVLWEVDEAPRFFEAFVRGKNYTQLSHLTSRICGICSIGHSLASLRATENAMKVEISEQTRLLRRLALHGENLQSHSLHVGYLVAPDLLGAPSVVPLVKTHRDAVVKIVSLHKLANYISDLTCGRTIHPITLEVGGFTSIPTEKELLGVKQQILEALEVTNEVAGIVKANAHKLPDFNRETEFIGLVADDHYPYYQGEIGSTDGGRWPEEDYLKVTNEYVVPHSTAKHTKNRRDSYMVGALARFNLNYRHLTDEAKGVAELFGLEPVCHNPYMNSIAQLVEIVDSFMDSMKLIDTLIANGLKQEKNEVEIRPGRGVGAVEVPRGILFHDYTIDELGNCIKANCIIPTNQNHGNIQRDMEAIGPTLLGKPEKDIELTLEMLVRAYDPCISCSTHYLDITFD
jgi:coenzyme F420-reducing hydrogenase alpha subunit